MSDQTSAVEGAPGTAPKRKRAWLLLWIGAPVVIVVVLAAVLVPGMIRSANARGAADQYQQQKKVWSKTFDDKALAPFASMDPAAFGTAYLALQKSIDWSDAHWSVPKDTEVAKVCAGYAELADAATKLDAKAPVLAKVDGGKDTPEYAAAAKDAEKNAAAYQASASLAKDAKSSFETIAQICDYAAAENVADIAMVAPHNAYIKTLSRKKGQIEVIRNIGSRQYYQPCTSSLGCASIMNMAERRATADAWDASTKAEFQGIADLDRDHCPKVMVKVCAVERQAMQDDLKSAAAISPPLRDDDPRKLSDAEIVAGADPFAKVDAASKAYLATYAAGTKKVAAELKKEFDTADGNAAMSKLASDAVQKVKDAVTAVQGAGA